MGIQSRVAGILCRNNGGSGLEDEFLWLEAIEGDEALAWVRDQNERTRETLADHPRFETFYGEALAALNEDSRIPDITLHAG
ncbi:MAG: hypothetical protein U5O39_06280 [Gammaproteobacteria bacterium]|nr:hypothetical protein [Gammaproteobacteria bacterium]